MITQDSFSQWMRKHTALSDSSIYKYAHAVNTISDEMLGLKVILKSLSQMNLIELDIAIANILNNSHFIHKNNTGNNMYSNSLKQYRYFILDTSENESFEYKIIDTIKSSNISDTEKEAIIKARIGQGLYRKNLINKYDCKCVVTGIDNPKLLMASHIKPWSICNNHERIDLENGLLLSANMDKLFDCGLITFSQNGKMFISSYVGKENEKRLQISKDKIVNLKATNELLNYLEYHRDILFVK